ncbi:hypothetical protein PAECIP111890_05694 [Paenibacillus sp. JJ-223]|nr:hypothetical protein PAECIP111890_05694 [Paenibacillus sp. JJ-223]
MALRAPHRGFGLVMLHEPSMSIPTWFRAVKGKDGSSFHSTYFSNRNQPKSKLLPGRKMNVTFCTPVTFSSSNTRSS